MTATTLALALLVGGCSGNDEDGANKTTSTTTEEAVTTTAPVPLAKGAELWELAYLSTDAAQSTVFLTNGQGSGTEVIARVKGRAEQLKWSPDGSSLLLDGDATGDFELQVIDVESKEVSPLAPSASSNEGGAVWSPDGSEVAFFSNREGPFAGYVVTLDGGAVRRITPPDAGAVTDLAWAPDGTTISFTSSAEIESDVWLVGADGSNPRVVSTEPGSSQAAWAPDGNSMAITAQPAGEETTGIYLLDPEEGTTTGISNTPYRDSFPTWSADGDAVYFVSALPNDDADGGDADDIFRVDVDRDEPEPIVSDPISIESELVATSDGRFVAFSVQRLGDKEIFVANSDGTGAIPVSRSERIDAFAAWRPGTGPDASKG